MSSILYFQSLSHIDPSISQAVWNMLCKYNNSFVPPLSGRSGTSDNDLLHPTGDILPTEYFSQLSRQEILVFRKHNQICGFMSFYGGYHCSEITGAGSALYVSTIIVDESFRGCGITKEMYNYLENRVAAARSENMIVTRTWSGNHSHLHILEKCGFKSLLCIEDDRGPGIDTLYYGKIIK